MEGLQEYARRQVEYKYWKNRLDTEKSKNYKDKDHGNKEKYNKTEKFTTNKLEIKEIVDLIRSFSKNVKVNFLNLTSYYNLI